LPPSADGNNIEGRTDENPIRLPDDPIAFATILGLYYQSISNPVPPTPNFDLAVGVLRVSTKYEFQHAREWALKHLRDTWDRSSPKWQAFLSNPTPELAQDAIRLIDVARETKADEFVSVAFYFLCVVDDLDWVTSGNTSFSPADLSILWKGSRCLLKTWGRAMGPEWNTFLRSEGTINLVMLAMGFGPQVRPTSSPDIPRSSHIFQRARQRRLDEARSLLAASQH